MEEENVTKGPDESSKSSGARGYPGNKLLTSMFYPEVASEPEEGFDEPYYVASEEFETDPWEIDFWRQPEPEEPAGVWEYEGVAGDDEVARWINAKRMAEKKKKMSRSTRRWTEVEEKKFEEALELYGRNWQSCATYIGTKDAGHVRSHAQKHFIRLFMEGKPVPRKCAETGEGHTLSGKELDPNSGAARSYFAKSRNKMWRQQTEMIGDGKRSGETTPVKTTPVKTSNAVKEHTPKAKGENAGGKQASSSGKKASGSEQKTTVASPRKLVIKFGGKKSGSGKKDELKGEAMKSKNSTEKRSNTKRLSIKLGGKKVKVINRTDKKRNSSEKSNSNEKSNGSEKPNGSEKSKGKKGSTTPIVDKNKEAASRNERRRSRRQSREKLRSKGGIVKRETQDRKDKKDKAKKVKFKLS